MQQPIQNGQNNNQGGTQTGLTPAFQDVLNNNQQQNGQNQPIPTPTIVQGGGNDGAAPTHPTTVNNNDIDLDAPGAEFGLDVRQAVTI